jgi:hypothetical protein
MYRRSFAPSAPAPRVFCFSVQAEAEPGIMPRVLELFAKRNLVPSRWVSDLSGTSRPGARRELSIDLQVEGLTPALSDYIAQCLRQIPGVTAVLTSEKGRVATVATTPQSSPLGLTRGSIDERVSDHDGLPGQARQ